MLKIHQLFFRTYILIFLISIFTIGLSTYFWAQKIYLDHIKTNLLQNIDTFSSLLENSNAFLNIDKIVNNLSEKLNLRISIIDINGVVIVESEKFEKINNHNDRIEIIEARTQAFGEETRFSETVNKNLIYVAKKVQINNDTYFIRMADYIDKIEDDFLELIFEILLYIAVFLTISFFITYFISSKIKKETDLILYFLKDLTSKKNPIPIESNYTFEFYKIAKLLNKVSKELSQKDLEKSKQTAKLKLANRQKDEIISAISHEFKNPIAIISGYSETILNEKELPVEMKNKFLEKILSNSNKMTQLIDKLRFTLKLEDQNQELILKTTSIKKLVESCVSDLKIKYKNRDILITGIDVNLDIDEVLISIAISNLIENALKYSQEEVLIEIENNKISIIDKGIGIEEKDLEKIKRKYYRAANNSWNNSLGLGLFIVQSILNSHNFKLEIKSEINNGSIFIIHY